MRLPIELEQQLWRAIKQMEGEIQMSYVTSVERLATQRGMQQGLQQGLQQGKLEGEAALLERQLIKRVGSLTEETRARLKAATADQLETWADRILDAPTLNAVFDSH